MTTAWIIQGPLRYFWAAAATRDPSRPKITAEIHF